MSGQGGVRRERHCQFSTLSPHPPADAGTLSLWARVNSAPSLGPFKFHYPQLIFS